MIKILEKIKEKAKLEIEEKEQDDTAVASFNIGGDDEPTVPMNPDYFNVTRINKSLDSMEHDDDPFATQETPSAGIVGEGHDSLDSLF